MRWRRERNKWRRRWDDVGCALTITITIYLFDITIIYDYKLTIHDWIHTFVRTYFKARKPRSKRPYVNIDKLGPHGRGRPIHEWTFNKYTYYNYLQPFIFQVPPDPFIDVFFGIIAIFVIAGHRTGLIPYEHHSSSKTINDNVSRCIWEPLAILG